MDKSKFRKNPKPMRREKPGAGSSGPEGAFSAPDPALWVPSGPNQPDVLLFTRPAKPISVAAKHGGRDVRKNLAVALGLILGAMTVSGCVPVAVGAVGAVAADSIAEDHGNDLF